MDRGIQEVRVKNQGDSHSSGRKIPLGGSSDLQRKQSPQSRTEANPTAGTFMSGFKKTLKRIGCWPCGSSDTDDTVPTGTLTDNSGDGGRGATSVVGAKDNGSPSQSARPEIDPKFKWKLEERQKAVLGQQATRTRTVLREAKSLETDRMLPRTYGEVEDYLRFIDKCHTMGKADRKPDALESFIEIGNNKVTELVEANKDRRSKALPSSAESPVSKGEGVINKGAATQPSGETPQLEVIPPAAPEETLSQPKGLPQLEVIPPAVPEETLPQPKELPQLKVKQEASETIRSTFQQIGTDVLKSVALLRSLEQDPNAWQRALDFSGCEQDEFQGLLNQTEQGVIDTRDVTDLRKLGEVITDFGEYNKWLSGVYDDAVRKGKKQLDKEND